MEVRIEPRVEVAIRSLQPPDQERSQKAISALRNSSFVELTQRGKLKALQQHILGPGHFSLRISQKLRAIVHIEGDKCAVLDIFSHDSLNRILRQRGAQ